MTPAQIRLVQSTYAEVKPVSEEVAALFCGRLGEIAPECQAPLGGDLHGQKLMRNIGYGVEWLHCLGAVSEPAKRPGFCELQFDALIWTLEKLLGGVFTAEVREAWLAAYTVIAANVRHGGGKAQAAAA